MSYLPTVHGKRVDILHPEAEQIHLLDIATGLSRLPRYLGQYHAPHYSVAEHCVLMAREAPPEDAIHFLLHDAPEAYLGDIIHPVKVLFPELNTTEDRLLAAIYEALDLEEPSDEVKASVHDFDMRIRSTEKMHLVQDNGEWPELAGHPPFEFWFPCWDAETAKREWLKNFAIMNADYVHHRRAGTPARPAIIYTSNVTGDLPGKGE